MDFQEKNIMLLKEKRKVNVQLIGGLMSSLDIIKVQTIMRLLYLEEKMYLVIQNL